MSTIMWVAVNRETGGCSVTIMKLIKIPSSRLLASWVEGEISCWCKSALDFTDFRHLRT
jgi:hypothetical protein